MAVYPVHNNIFKINTLGRTTPENFVTIADMETFEPGIASKTEEWTPMDQAGWIRRAVTGKGLAFKFKGKRNYGDTGNDYVADTILATGTDAESILQWTLPNGDVLTMDCVIDLKQTAGGDSVKIDTLDFEVLSDGLPVYAASGGTLGTLAFECVDGSVALTTQIETIVPTLGGSNEYWYKINGLYPDYDEVITAANGWAPYTLSDDIPVIDNNMITLVEVVTATKKAQKAGQAEAVVV